MGCVVSGVIRLRGFSVTELIERALDYSATRHRVLADNIANVNTPGFRRRDVDFSVVLRDAVRRDSRPLPLMLTHERHIAGPRGGGTTSPVPLREEGAFVRADRAGVDVDYEMVQLAANSLYYQALLRELSWRLGILRSAITEGRR